MTVLSDRWIKKMSKDKGMIRPFVSKQVRKGKISFGLSSYGYDARVSNEFKIFTNVNSGIVDPKLFKKEASSLRLARNVLYRPILLLWPELWSISKYRKMFLLYAWANLHMRDAG